MKHERDISGTPPQQVPVGAVRVGMVGTLSLPAQMLIACFRLHGSAGRDYVEAGHAHQHALLRQRMAPAEALACLEALHDLFDSLARCGRRRLIPHAPECSCLGADEAVVAHFVSTAAMGAREDAMLLASLLAEGATLLRLTDTAQRAGLYLERAGRRAPAFPDPCNATRH